MNIAGREYPTPLVVGGVAGVLALVVGQRLLGGSKPSGDAAPDPDAAASQLRAGAGPPTGGQDELGQFPAADSSYDWWDAGGGGGSASYPPAGGLNDPGPTPPPTPIAPPPTPTPAPAPKPAPTRPAGTVAKVTLPRGSYKTGRVSGTTFVGYGPTRAGGYSAWASRPIKLKHGATVTTWFKMLSGPDKGRWFYRYDPHIRWQPI